ncbi:MAG: mycothiol conjugate amidase Mca [Corynebacterium sp.]|nr:mycothiol conjugate amidase Mca [Corynebacterium sp.]
MSDLRLMAIHAHPDDESSKGAATMARYAATGVDVRVITCTGGEQGSILNPAMDKPGVLDRLPEIRKSEMAKAAAALGVSQRWLGYKDSGLPEGDPPAPLAPDSFALQPNGKVVGDLVREIRDFRPQVIITYDENGGYPHPDHLKVHEVSMLAWDAAGDADAYPGEGEPFTPSKLYYSHGFIRQRMELFHNLLVDAGKPSPFDGLLDRWDASMADIMSRVTTRIPCADYFPQRDAALEAHASQIDPHGIFFSTERSVEAKLWPTEEFELAATRVSTTLPEKDLFAGIADVLGDA